MALPSRSWDTACELMCTPGAGLPVDGQVVARPAGAVLPRSHQDVPWVQASQGSHGLVVGLLGDSSYRIILEPLHPRNTMGGLVIRADSYVQQ